MQSVQPVADPVAFPGLAADGEGEVARVARRKEGGGRQHADRHEL